MLPLSNIIAASEKHRFCFMLKTFRNDCLGVVRLLRSFQQFNRDGIHLYLVCPDGDVDFFVNRIKQSDNITFIQESLFAGYLVDAPFTTRYGGNFSAGYINQEIIKLAFWETGLCENYLCLDSDGEFIRNFYYVDFMVDDHVPYSVLVEDNALKVDPYYFKEYWPSREAIIRLIQKEIGFESEVLLTAHGFITININVMRDFHKNFMMERTYAYADLLSIAAFEFSWYNMWLQKCGVIPVILREPFFLYFHHEHQLKAYKAQGISKNDLARGYIGITINSSFLPDRGQHCLLEYDEYDAFMPVSPKLCNILRYSLQHIVLVRIKSLPSFLKCFLRPFLGPLWRKIQRK